jgi:large subunit ribosomal protein L9
MFGSVTVPNLLERLKEDGIELERKQINLAQPIKELGRHQVTVKLHADVQVSVNIEVVSENPIDEEEE